MHYIILSPVYLKASLNPIVNNGVIIISGFRSVPSSQPQNFSGLCLTAGFDYKSQIFMLVDRLSCPITLSLPEASGFFTCHCLAVFPSLSAKFYIVAHLSFPRRNTSEFPANLNKKTVICN